jgi:hypothetical protein
MVIGDQGSKLPAPCDEVEDEREARNKKCKRKLFEVVKIRPRTSDRGVFPTVCPVVFCEGRSLVTAKLMASR